MEVESNGCELSSLPEVESNGCELLVHSISEVESSGCGQPSIFASRNGATDSN